MQILYRRYQVDQYYATTASIQIVWRAVSKSDLVTLLPYLSYETKVFLFDTCASTLNVVSPLWNALLAPRTSLHQGILFMRLLPWYSFFHQPPGFGPYIMANKTLHEAESVATYSLLHRTRA